LGTEMDNDNIVRTLWHGTTLTIYEELSIRSFLKCGHRVEVYSYGDVTVPQGVQVCDANAILPRSKVFSYPGGIAKGSFAAFSNLFRFKMLCDKGGIWADSDVLCLRPLHDLPAAAVGRVDNKWLNGAILKFSAGHPVCQELALKIEMLGCDLELGQTAGLLTRTVAKNVALCHVLPVGAFYPIHSTETWRLLDPTELDKCEQLSRTSYCVHWWNAVLTMAIGLPKEALPPVGSYLYNRAEETLESSELKAWPNELAQGWLRNHRISAHAKQASGAKNWPEAVKLWTAVVDGSGEKATSEMWVNLARAHRNNGDLPAAKAAVENATSTVTPGDPNAFRVARERAEIATAQKDWPQALAGWRAFVDDFPQRVGGNDFARMIRALRNQGDLDAADAVGREAVSLYPKDVTLARECAEVATMRENWVEAAERWKAVLSAYGSPAPARVYLRASQALRHKGDTDGAYALIHEALEAKPDDPRLRRECATLASLPRNSAAQSV
jgi:tetratricopeptide (TPR) repeat protein